MSESAQAFYLRLNNHKNFMSDTLFRLYRDQTLVDCTLAAEGRQLSAHRLVLAAFSPYFKDMLTQYQTSQNPVIVIKDMPFRDLKAMVEYIYRGEVTVSRNKIRSLLENGADLQVKGLAEFDRNKWISDLDDDETGADDHCSDSDSDNGSIDKNYSKGLTNNSVNGFELSENIENNKKQTRKTRHRLCSPNGSADREPGKCDRRVWPSVSPNDIHTNDRISNDDNHSKSEDLNKNSIKIMNGNQKINTNKDQLSETGFRPSLGSPLINTEVLEHYVPNAMTDVNQASHSSQFSSGGMIGESGHTISTDASPDANEVFPPMIPMTDNNTNVMSFGIKLIQTQSDSDLKITDKNISANKWDQNKAFNDIRAEEVIERSAQISGNEILISTNIQNDSQSMKSMTDEKQKQQIERNASNISKVDMNHKKRSLVSHKRFQCPECQKIYSSLQNMKEHLRITHTKPVLKYKCSVCQKEYSWRHALDRHRKTKHCAQ